MWESIGSMFQSGSGGPGGGFNPNRIPGGGAQSSRYSCNLVAYPLSFLENKMHAEEGDKIFLPHSLLAELSVRNVAWPMTFKLENPYTQRVIHCGVMEFSADEGTCYMPNWMMQNLLLRDNDIIRLENVALPKGKKVKIQPCSKTFIEIEDPRGLLERSLGRFACLTVGELLPISYNGTTYELEVLELDPAPAACIIETDLNVDFAPPKDWTEADEYGGCPPPTEELETEDAQGNPIDPMPWLTSIQYGVRAYDDGFNRLVQEGRVPGVIRDRKLQETIHAKNAFNGSGCALGSKQ